MANSLTGGYGLRPIGMTGAGYNSTGTTMYEIAITTLMRFIKVAL